MAWTGGLTENGIALLQQWANEKTLHIDYARGYQTNTQKDQVNIAAKKSIDGGVSVQLLFGPKAAQYTLNKIRIYARIDDGADTDLAEYTGSQVIPASSTAEDFMFSIWCALLLDESKTFEVTVDSGIGVTVDALNAAIASVTNSGTLSSPNLTGTPITTTPNASSPNPAQVANVEFVTNSISAAINGLAPLENAAFTGTTTAVTPANTSNNNQVATTRFVQNLISAIPAAVIDNTVTNNSDHAVKSSGIYNFVSNAIANIPAAVIDNTVTNNSDHAVKSSGIYNFVSSSINAAMTNASISNVTINSGTISNVTITNANISSAPITLNVNSTLTSNPDTTNSNNNQIATTHFVRAVINSKTSIVADYNSTTFALNFKTSA